MDIAADIFATLGEVKHDIANPLAGAVIGVPPAAPCVIDGELLAEQLGGVGAGAAGVKRWMFEQPDQFARPFIADRGLHRLHACECFWVSGQFGGDFPVDFCGGRHGVALAQL